MKPMKNRLLQPAFHRAVHVAALRAVTFVDEDIEATRDGRRIALKVSRVELVDQRAEETRRRCAEILDELRRVVMRGEAASGPITPAFFITPSICLSSFVAVGDDEDASCGFLLENPLGEQHHHDALSAALGVPDDTPFVLLDACPRGHYAEELMRPRHLLLPGVEDHEIANEVRNRALLHIWASGRSISAPASGSASGRSSFQSTKNCSGVPVVP